MASSSVPTLPKTAPKKNLKRIMLAKAEELVVELSEDNQEAIINEVVTFIGTLKTREEVDKAVMLGFNNISRKAEQCDEDLKIVLLNAKVKPEMMITTLSKLCHLKRIPVGSLENFSVISEALRPLVKGLKPTCAAIGILASSPEEFRTRLISELPPVIMPEEPTKVKRLRIPPPPCPDVDVRKFHIRVKEQPPRSQPQSLGFGLGEIITFTQDRVPIVDYDSFIGSERPLESHYTSMEVEELKGGPSSYKQPIMKYR